MIIVLSNSDRVKQIKHKKIRQKAEEILHGKDNPEYSGYGKSNPSIDGDRSPQPDGKNNDDRITPYGDPDSYKEGSEKSDEHEQERKGQEEKL